ncbi:apolipoprotein L3-like [Octodon degus]|uniref:Apolipoprotein L3-like n=1 Tax=Octodon degus TaxID=10160 RepID=A0A6P6EQS3_OCTDE|nr:apolipoprotein L3-like [Octodon degus]
MEDQRSLQEDILARKKLLKVFPEVEAEFESCVQKLRALAEEVDQVHKGCTISNVVTSSVGAASDVMNISGLTLAPFTVGGSLLLSAAGKALGVLTALSGITTSVIEESSMSSAEAEAKRILSTAENNLMRLLKLLGNIVSKNVMKIVKFCENMKGLVMNIRALRVARANPGLARDAMHFPTRRGLFAQMPQQVQRAFPGTPLSLTTGARIGNVALGTVSLGMNGYNIYKESKHLYEGAKSPLAEQLRQKAEELEEELKEIKQILQLCC